MDSGDNRPNTTIGVAYFWTPILAYFSTPIDNLIDGDFLCDLLKQLNLGVNTELVERVVVDQEWLAKV